VSGKPAIVEGPLLPARARDPRRIVSATDETRSSSPSRHRGAVDALVGTRGAACGGAPGTVDACGEPAREATAFRWFLMLRTT